MTAAPPAATGRTVHTLDARGTVRDWLIGPAWTTPCGDLDAVLPGEGSPWGPAGRWVLTNGPDVAPLKEELYRRRPLVTDQAVPEPLEGAKLTWVAPGRGTDTGSWTRFHTAADGFVDWSEFCYTPVYRHAVAAAVIEVDQPEWRTLVVASTGPVAVWVGSELAGVFTSVSYMDPVEHRLPARFPSGTTTVVLATWQVAFRECRHVVRLRLEGLPVRVIVPAAGADEYASAIAEQVLERIAVRSWALPDGVARLDGPAGASLLVGVQGATDARRVRLRDGSAELRLAATNSREPAAGETAATMLATGETTLTVRLDDDRCPVSRRFRVAVLPQARRAAPVGEATQWRAEVLGHVAGTRPSVARALARWAEDPSARVTAADLGPALTMLDDRADCADFEAVGLMHLWHRVAAERWDGGLRGRARLALLGFKYWIDQPGLDAMCYFTENHQLVWHTAELLAGEAYVGETFSNSGWTGADHASHGRALAVEWMRRKLATGFSEFDSNAYVAIDCLALISLAEFAGELEVRQLAEALLDKLLLSLASNSWRGIHGSAHARSYVPTLRSARFEETAPLMWALWGMGALNAAVLPAAAIATARRYRLPPLIRAVAHDDSEVWEGRQVYRGSYRLEHDLLSRPYGSDLRIWRTPDAMLSSVQEYRAGLPGLQEHVWGATLGAEVQVFATHPANDVHDSSARPNAWAGQRILPRVRQHRDTLLVLHRLPADDPVGMTHLWLPAPLVDEWAASGPWLAARVGDGYVAVAAEGGLVPLGASGAASETWRPRGEDCGYVATVGRRAVDGSFTEFVAALRPPAFEMTDVGEPIISWVARDGRVLELSWRGPFSIDGRPFDVGPDGAPEAAPHLDYPAYRHEFGAARLEAAHDGQRLVLDLVRGLRLEPPSGVTPDAR